MDRLPPKDTKRLRRMRIACGVFTVLYVAHAPLAGVLGEETDRLASTDVGAMATITGLVTTVVLTLLWCFGLSGVIRTSLLAVMAFLAVGSWLPLVLYALGKHTGTPWLLAYQALLALASVVAAGSVLETRAKWPKAPDAEPPVT